MIRELVLILTLTGFAMGQAMMQHATAVAGGTAAAVGSKKIADSLETILGGVSSSAATAGSTPKQQLVPAPPAPATARRTKHSPFEPQANRNGAGSEMAPAAGQGGGIPSPSEVESGSTSSGEAVPNNPWAPRGRGHQQTPVPAFSAFGVNDAPAPTASRGIRRNVVGAPQLAESALIPPPAPPVVVLQAIAVPPPPPPPTLATREKLAEIQQGASYEQIVATLGTPASKIEMIEDGKVLENLRIESRGNKIGTIRLTNGIVTSVEPAALMN